MDDPQSAIHHARALAPDVVVFDHSPSSDWAFYAAEEKKVRRSAEALAHFNIKRHRSVYAEPTFKDHFELVAKLKTEGELAIQRAARFAGATNIVIPMPCDLTLLERALFGARSKASLVPPRSARRASLSFLKLLRNFQ
jgi:hypothetical protein